MAVEQAAAVQQKPLFDAEQEFIAPGLQTIALLSQLAIDHGSGCTLTDVNGKTYLDLNAGVSVASLGHAHPRYVAALTEQLKRISVGSFTSRPRLELVRLIAELAPGGLTRTQFFSGGAEAVEAAIRLARSYTKRTHIVGFTGGFHGKTAGVLPISDVDWKRDVGPLPPDQHVAMYPDVTTFGGTTAECAAASIDSLRRVIENECGGRPAAIIIEPIQGTAGNIVPPDSFLRTVREAGFSGVQNFPTVGLFDGIIRQHLEETGMGYDLEVEMIRCAHEMDLLTCPYVFTPGEAEKMAAAGADILVPHMGLTTKGMIGAQTALTLQECAERIQAMHDAAKAVNPDVLVLCHGGPISEPEDAAFILGATRGIVGFFGASSIERIPTERAITAQVALFKELRIGTPRPIYS